MRATEIGINLIIPGARLALLEQELAAVKDMGFGLVEIDHAPFPLIIDGELHAPSVAAFRSVVKASGLLCTLHGFCRLNLAFDPRHDLCKRIMRAQIRLCRELGAARLVYHSGLQALDEVHDGLRRTLLSPEERAAGARREVQALRELAPMAADAGVVICMENLDPHRWEPELIRQFGLPDAALAEHLPRLMVGPIVRQLEAIDSPHVAMTLDFAHLYLSSQLLQFPYLEAVKEATPWVRHLHVNDNFGRLDHGTYGGTDRASYGEADMHMPPGWGKVPHEAAWRLLPDYSGDMILEIDTMFRESWGSARDAARDLLDRVRS